MATHRGAAIFFIMSISKMDFYLLLPYQISSGINTEEYEQQNRKSP